MSTAILISGQLRTFARCWPTQRWHVLRHFADPHFFITVQEAGDHAVALHQLYTDYGPDRVHLDTRTDPDLSAHLTPELGRAYHLAPYTNAAPAHQLLLQHWYQQEVWNHFLNAQRSTFNAQRSSFQTIIRMRADLWFHSLDWDFDVERSALSVERFARSAWTPWWGRFGGINDRFAIMGPEAAKYYFTVFDRIPELLDFGCPFHPESLVKAALERGNVDLHETLRTEFSTERLNGQSRPPEIAPWDLAHCGLRSA